MGNRRCLLIFDQVEDLLDISGKFKDDLLGEFFETVIRYHDYLTIITTSRVEVNYRYDLRRFTRVVTLIDGIPTSDGIELLLELDATTPNKRLTQREESELGGLVELVHGVPRALELISAVFNDNLRFSKMSIEQIRAKFFEIPDVLAELVEEAYTLQNSESRRIMEILSAFRVSVSMKAVAYVLTEFFPLVDIDRAIDYLSKIHILSTDENFELLTLHPIDMS